MKFSVVFATLICCVLADFSDDFDTKPNIRVNYLSQNSGKKDTQKSTFFLGKPFSRTTLKMPLRTDCNLPIFYACFAQLMGEWCC